MSTRIRTHNITVIGIVLSIVAAIIVIALVVPHQKNTTTPVGQNVSTDAGLVLPLVELEGQWLARDNDTAFIGTVSGQDLEIQVSFSGETAALYWHGTFKSAESPGATIVSTKTEGPDEIVLSQSKEKEFHIKQGAITFDFSAMGFTKTVTMTR